MTFQPGIPQSRDPQVVCDACDATQSCLYQGRLRAWMHTNKHPPGWRRMITKGTAPRRDVCPRCASKEMLRRSSNYAGATTQRKR